MDYKYIEQLLERYWNCESTLEEEVILRAFFRQKELPAHLQRYRSLFAYQATQPSVGLDDEFDRRVLAQIERPIVKARRLSLRTRFMPLFKAAAVMALLFTMGGIIQQSVGDNKSGVVYVYDQFCTPCCDPQMAEADTAKAPLKATSATTASPSVVEKLK